MPANTPQEVSKLIGQRLGSRDLDGVMELYEPNACLVPEPGQLLKGTAAIRKGTEDFIALKPTITVESESVVQADDLAIVYTKWSLSGTGSDGSTINMGGMATDVMRRQPNGTWLCVIDNPFGGG